MTSIIIPTFNRCVQLCATLQSLVRLKTQRELFEIIVVDNGSTDSTREIVNSFQLGNEDVDIKYFYDDAPGLLTGRHRGASEAKGDILTFIDDDVHLSTAWLDTIIDVMKNREDITLLTGPNLPLFETYPPKWLDYFWSDIYKGKCCSCLSLLDLGDEIQEIHPNFVWGLNFTIRKSAFLELRGFHPDSMPAKYQLFQGDGETGLTMKAHIKGFIALYHPDVLLYHEVTSSRLTLGYFEKRAYFQGVCNSFTDLRGRQCVNFKTIKESNILNKKRVLSKVKRVLKRILFLKRNNNNNKLTIPTDVKNILERVSIKEKEGYEFHQNIYYDDEIVKNWVHKDDFMEYKLPSE
jgi:glycosyltransferase involved in cell wall biosynthesis